MRTLTDDEKALVVKALGCAAEQFVAGATSIEKAEMTMHAPTAQLLRRQSLEAQLLAKDFEDYEVVTLTVGDA
jgi:hypothetical protein